MAPPRYRATFVGAVFLSLFVGNLFVGWLGALFERMTPMAFWAMHAAIAAAGAILALLLNIRLGRTWAVHPRLSH